MKPVFFIAFSLVLISATSCRRESPTQTAEALKSPAVASVTPVVKSLPVDASPELKQLIDGAIEQAGVTVGYDPSYVAIGYPNGDVPVETGVCSDVVVRAFRKAGLDLQREVHEDMVRAWSAYPSEWGARRPDKNIDHRRVLNLMRYFERKGRSVPVTSERNDYQPGDIVSWNLNTGVPHIGIVINHWSPDSNGYLIVHNIGAGAKIEDVLFNWKVTGHYRYFVR
jgi:uncharacterized protein YijF (DUF1287 family)